MDTWILSHANALRMSTFLGVLLAMCALEATFPRRRRNQTRSARWVTNAGMLVLATALVRVMAFLAPVLAGVAAAGLAAEQGWGLFHQLDFAGWGAVLAGMIFLDFAIWAQHWATHRIPLLWRLHRVHHGDRDLDATSALRFHPLEIALSLLLKVALVLALGLPVLAVLIFEVLLNACAMFNHANLALPGWLDRVLRPILVTPDMHRVHHSIHRDEHDTNYGFCLSLWDRLFRTYTREPRGGHDGMVLGLKGPPGEASEKLGASLTRPFEPL
ncbi:MAG: sterol desaturase family protein [Hyphomonadaceae bacterium]|nr:sterol desaturase family protein [Hyphomonadaceae bacterium]